MGWRLNALRYSVLTINAAQSMRAPRMIQVKRGFSQLFDGESEEVLGRAISRLRGERQDSKASPEVEYSH